MYKCLIRGEGGIILSKFHSGLERCKILEVLKKEGAKIHFIGASGIGMYSLAALSSAKGYTVSGSDSERTELAETLASMGCEIEAGHRWENALGKDLLVYTLAVNGDNPELLCAEQEKIPAVSRAEYLGAIMESYNERIGVSGTHGKSTTTAMLDAIFSKAGLVPTTLVGARLPHSDSPLRIGNSTHLIYEACEYKDSFLRFSPTAAIFTNLELDHVDYFNSLDDIKESFLKAMNMPRLSVYNADDSNLSELASESCARTVSFGTVEGADYRALISGGEGGYYTFKIRHGARDIIKVRLSVPGRFNAMNAAGAAALSLELGIPPSDVEYALSSFCGIERRLELIGEYNGAPVYYDYAHHPTEIENAIRTVKELAGGPVTVIFKPHTYSRTAGLMDGFVKALSLAERVLLCEISAIRESAIDGVSSEVLASLIGKSCVLIKERGFLNELRDSAAIIIMGAANLDAVKREIFGK